MLSGKKALCYFIPPRCHPSDDSALISHDTAPSDLYPSGSTLRQNPLLTEAALGTVIVPKVHSPAVTMGTAASTKPAVGQFRS